MYIRQVLDAMSCVSPKAVALAFRHPSELGRYISCCLKTYDELVGNGLPSRAPVTPTENITVTIPGYHPGGGMRFDELVILARAVRVLKPRTIFEMGTYDGLTTAVFMLNSDSSSQILTLDLPHEADIPLALPTDQQLTTTRRLNLIPQALGLHRYTQLLCDSMQFDPSPYADSIDLGLVDAAHDAVHVRNDTQKMAKMMSRDGMVFWHDYGGKGSLRPLSSYLETLAKSCPVYRIRGTTLAWAPARELRSAIDVELTKA
jgi:predicted O-methyltransferase YrrM